MKFNLIHIYIILLFLTNAVVLNAQKFSIHADSSIPNNSAMLDVSDIPNGILPPSLNTNQMNAIVSLVEGIFTHNVTSTSCMYYRGSSGVSIGSRSMIIDEIYSAKDKGSRLVDGDGEDWIQNVNHPSSGKDDIIFRSGYFNADLVLVVSCRANCGGNIASYNNWSKNGVTVFLITDSRGSLEVENEVLPPSKGGFKTMLLAMAIVNRIYGVVRASDDNMTYVITGTDREKLIGYRFDFGTDIVNAMAIDGGKAEITVVNGETEFDVTTSYSVGVAPVNKDFSIIRYSA
ncbi:MAG: hypothetical protein ACJARP_001845 [Vicingaceae bacterium]|jgi:hypothetical protein